MCDATIVTLYKNKGDRSYCNNYRGISLLSIVRKVFARILLTRLHTLAARIYPESQCGFRAERSTIDMIFTLRQIQEKCREQGKPLYLTFIDLTKVFNLVSRKGLFQLLEKIGCSPKLRILVVSFHGDMKGTVMYDRSCSDPFPVKSGVKQGIFLASSFHSFCLTPSGHHLTAYIYTHELMANCSASHAFAQRQKCRKSSCYLPMTHPLQPTQKRPYRDFSQSCKDLGLTISIKKTNVSDQDVSQAPSIKIDHHTLDVVEEFTHLGSTISMNLCLDTEINKRIGKASATVAKLTQRVWKNSLLTQKAKVRVYQACILSTLLYGSETWTTYMRQERRLNIFYMRYLRRILDIKWQDHIPNSNILTRTGVPSMYCPQGQRRLRWLGHVRRMEDGRIPKDVFYGQLASGSRRVGRSALRFKGTCKRGMKACKIDTDTWEDAAGERAHWRQKVKQEVEHADSERGLKAADKRARRKLSAASTTNTPTGFICSASSRDCRSRIGLYSHTRRCSSTKTVE